MKKSLFAAVMTVVLLYGTAFAEVVCVKGNSITTAKKCTSGAKLLTRSNFASLLGIQTFAGTQGPQGPQGPQGLQGSPGPQGPAGLVNLQSCVRESITNSCSGTDVCQTEIVCGGTGTSAGSQLNDYMIGWDWTNNYSGSPTTGLNGAYMTESGFYFATGKTYPTGMWIKTTSEDGYGSHNPGLAIICCLPH